MKKLVLLFTVFLTVAAVSAQTLFTDGDHTFRINDATGDVYLYETTATGAVTFPVNVSQNGFIPKTVSGVHTDFISQGAGITSATFPVGYKTYEANCLRGMVDVETIVFEGGEVFGGKICRSLGSLNSVVLPTTITSWGTEIFSESNLSTIDLGNCPEINNRMFRQTNVTELTLPASVTLISEQAWNSSPVVTLICESSTPATIESTWNGTAANITAYVPDAAVATYQAAPIWADMTILAASTFSINSARALNVSVYPNPTSDNIFVKTKQNSNIDLAVYDLNGRVLLATKGNQVNISHLSHGVYILKGTTEKGEFAQRIMKL